METAGEGLAGQTMVGESVTTAHGTPRRIFLPGGSSLVELGRKMRRGEYMRRGG